jgi:hypothetical protein
MVRLKHISVLKKLESEPFPKQLLQNLGKRGEQPAAFPKEGCQWSPKPRFLRDARLLLLY